MQEIEVAAGQSLLSGLRRAIPPNVGTFDMSTLGGTVRVKAVANAGQRSCITTCSLFIVQESFHSPAYLTYFEEEGHRIAWGKSTSESEMTAAIYKWLGGSTLELLYRDFEFIDREKRRLTQIRETVVEAVPSITIDANVELSEYEVWSALWFRCESRAVMVDGASQDAFFSWDQTNLFRWKVGDAQILAAMILRWVSEDVAPSAMKVEFPWLNIGRLADF